MIFRRHVPPEEEAYRRLAKKGFTPGSIIDVGAYEGNWTRMARRLFDAPVLMVEAQEAKRSQLEAVANDLGAVDIHIAPLSDKIETVRFFEMETGSSLMPERSNVERTERTLQTNTLDTITGDMPAPIFLKIDTQGAELKVLSGGQETLARCGAVQLEVALLAYNEGAPQFREVIDFMDERGFVPFDFSGYSRPNGIDLVQVDIIFVPRDSKLRPDRFEF